MKNRFYLSAFLVFLLFTSCNQPTQPPTIGEMQFPEGEVQHAVIASETDWSPCPPNLPGGCNMIVLEGNPKDSDLFSVRFKMAQGMKMPAHTHPKDERVTILSGQLSVAFGKDATYADAKHFLPGDYYVNKRGAVHTVWVDSNSVIQITGIGPWEANFVE